MPIVFLCILLFLFHFTSSIDRLKESKRSLQQSFEIATEHVLGPNIKQLGHTRLRTIWILENARVILEGVEAVNTEGVSEYIASARLLEDGVTLIGEGNTLVVLPVMNANYANIVIPINFIQTSQLNPGRELVVEWELEKINVKFASRLRSTKTSISILLTQKALADF